MGDQEKKVKSKAGLQKKTRPFRSGLYKWLINDYRLDSVLFPKKQRGIVQEEGFDNRPNFSSTKIPSMSPTLVEEMD